MTDEAEESIDWNAAAEAKELMSFSSALQALYDGRRVARAGWTDGDDVFGWLIHIEHWGVLNSGTAAEALKRAQLVQSSFLPFIGSYDGQNFSPWSANQEDILGEDWLVLKEDA